MGRARVLHSPPIALWTLQYMLYYFAVTEDMDGTERITQSLMCMN